MIIPQKTLYRQALKYAVVGAGNTLLTFIIYIAMTELLGLSKSLSNITGYAVGLINSFIWNKKWTFRKSDTTWLREALTFLAMFIICYLLQKIFFDYLNTHLATPHIFNFIVAMIFYNITFFISNKYLIFKKNG